MDHCPAALLSLFPAPDTPPLLFPCHPSATLVLHGQDNASITLHGDNNHGQEHRENIHREVVLELSTPGMPQHSSTPRLCIPMDVPVICQTRTSVLRETIGVTSPLSGPHQLEPGVNDLYFTKCFKILG